MMRFQSLRLLLGFLLLPISLPAETDAAPPTPAPPDEATSEESSEFPTEPERLTRETWRAGDQVRLHLEAEDDVFLFANTLELRGRFRHDLWAVGRRINVKADAQSNVRLIASEVLTFDGTVERGLRAHALGNMLINTNTVVRGHTVLSSSGTLTLHGHYEGDVDVSAPRLVIDAHIAGSLILQSPETTLLPGTRIDGNLYHRSERPPPIPKSVVAGDIIAIEPAEGLEDTLQKLRWQLRMIQVLTSFAIGLLMVRFLPRFTGHCVETMLKLQPGSLMLGFLTTVLFGITIFLLAASQVGIGISIVLGMILFLLVYTGKIIVALSLGAMIVKHRAPLTFFRLALGLLVGLLALQALFAAPAIGTTIWMLVSCWGMGVMIQNIRDSQRVLKLEIPEKLRDTQSDSTS